jgi:hypothetical protein
MTIQKTSYERKNPQREPVRLNLSAGYHIALTVLHMEGSTVERGKAEGKVISIDKSEIEISTSFPLKPRQMLYWVDKHQRGNFHFATVKSSKKSDDTYLVRLSIL